MSMQPHAAPEMISRISASKRVFLIRPAAPPLRDSISVLPSMSEKKRRAIAMPPWNPWCAMTETSARANISELSM